MSTQIKRESPRETSEATLRDIPGGTDEKIPMEKLLRKYREELCEKSWPSQVSIMPNDRYVSCLYAM